MFWFFYGLLVGAGVMRLFLSIKNGSIVIPWYGWIIGIITFLLATLTLQTFIASFQEREPKAAWMSLLFIGVPTFILATITFLTIR